MAGCPYSGLSLLSCQHSDLCDCFDQPRVIPCGSARCVNCYPPTDTDIDAEIAAANDRLREHRP